jgi:parvulin-like peptidyl-prolyl isomerase
MNLSLDFGSLNISSDLVIEQLNRFKLFPQLIQEIVVDDLVEEMAVAWGIELDASQIEFDRKYTQIEKLPFCQGMNESQLKAICDRELRLQQFKVARWGEEVESYFQVDRAEFLGVAPQDEDRVVVSILQVKDAALAQELFFRIESGESSFTEIALDYSQGIHAQNGGILGPLLWKDLGLKIRKILAQLEVGALSGLLQFDGYYTLFRLDEREPAQLDDLRYQFYLDRLFSIWLESQIAIDNIGNRK